MGRIGVGMSMAAVICAGMIDDAAFAALGEKRASVDTDRTRLVAISRSARSSASGTEHHLTLQNGTEVKELENAAGTIVAVSWHGPGRPDLRQLLGDQHFATFQAANIRYGRLRMRRAPQVERSDLIIRTGGHPGAFWGVAYLPAQIPAGVDLNNF
ncbi:MAG TPA: DUF2844 domain-containing protein [Afipia sp.]